MLKAASRRQIYVIITKLAKIYHAASPIAAARPAPRGNSLPQQPCPTLFDTAYTSSAQTSEKGRREGREAHALARNVCFPFSSFTTFTALSISHLL